MGGARSPTQRVGFKSGDRGNMYDITDLVAMLWLGRAFNTSPQSLLTDGKLAQALVLTAARRGPFGMLHALPWS